MVSSATFVVGWDMLKINVKGKSFIKNLIFHNLVMEIMQNSFIHNSYVSHINIVH
jgi:hypothetical protein